MIGENITILRKKADMSQEALAERIGVSRQTVAKWETGESVPDVVRCDALGELFEISIDDLVHADLRQEPLPPKGKHVFGTVRVGDKGQIVIPVKARRMFGLEPGTDLLVLGDEQQGIALIRTDFFLEVAKQMKGRMP